MLVLWPPLNGPLALLVVYMIFMSSFLPSGAGLDVGTETMVGQGHYSARLKARRDAVLGRRPEHLSGHGGVRKRTRLGAATIAVAVFGVLLVTSASGSGVQAGPVGQGFSITPADLRYILDQIKIGEAHVVNTTPETGP